MDAVESALLRVLFSSSSSELNKDCDFLPFAPAEEGLDFPTGARDLAAADACSLALTSRPAMETDGIAGLECDVDCGLITLLARFARGMSSSSSSSSLIFASSSLPCSSSEMCIFFLAPLTRRLRGGSAAIGLLFFAAAASAAVGACRFGGAAALGLDFVLVLASCSSNSAMRSSATLSAGSHVLSSDAQPSHLMRYSVTPSCTRRRRMASTLKTSSPR
mmetsp:Transcript_16060/g.41331  ORF Transcript_16060/g.41331 Transcript_16060/m.41331 type:complete len:219 (-) Transcript_16060:158-814(-)